MEGKARVLFNYVMSHLLSGPHFLLSQRQWGEKNAGVYHLAGVSGTKGIHDDHDLPSHVQINAIGEDEQFEVCPENIGDSLFLRNLALFYLKLLAKLLHPASTIQTIINDLQTANLNCFSNWLKSCFLKSKFSFYINKYNFVQ